MNIRIKITIRQKLSTPPDLARRVGVAGHFLRNPPWSDKHGLCEEFQVHAAIHPDVKRLVKQKLFEKESSVSEVESEFLVVRFQPGLPVGAEKSRAGFDAGRFYDNSKFTSGDATRASRRQWRKTATQGY
jgi:hypothetical protein